MKIEIKGAIISNSDKSIYDFFEMESTCPRDVISKIREAKGETIEVSINSGGGDVYAGAEIYTALKDYPGNVVGKITGIAASSASIVAMGCKKLKMSPVGQMMIHKTTMSTYGNHNKFEHAADVLKSHDRAIANSYMLKTGMGQKELIQLMDKETYFDANTALKYKFIDEIMFDDALKLSASQNSNTGKEIPQQIINKIRGLVGSENNSLEAQKKDFERIKLKMMESICK